MLQVSSPEHKSHQHAQPLPVDFNVSMVTDVEYHDPCATALQECIYHYRLQLLVLKVCYARPHFASTSVDRVCCVQFHSDAHGRHNELKANVTQLQTRTVSLAFFLPC